MIAWLDRNPPIIQACPRWTFIMREVANTGFKPLQREVANTDFKPLQREVANTGFKPLQREVHVVCVTMNLLLSNIFTNKLQ